MVYTHSVKWWCSHFVSIEMVCGRPSVPSIQLKFATPIKKSYQLEIRNVGVHPPF